MCQPIKFIAFPPAYDSMANVDYDLRIKIHFIFQRQRRRRLHNKWILTSSTLCRAMMQCRVLSLFALMKTANSGHRQANESAWWMNRPTLNNLSCADHATSSNQLLLPCNSSFNFLLNAFRKLRICPRDDPTRCIMFLHACIKLICSRIINASAQSRHSMWRRFHDFIPPVDWF